MAIQVSGTTVISNGRFIQGLSGLVIPSGNTSGRPGSPSQGQIYHNTETDEFEVYASVLVPGAYVTQYQGVVNGNNAIFMAARSEYNPPSGTATPLAFDTDFGIQFKTNESIVSTDGKEHRITATYNIGAGSTTGGYYWNGFGGGGTKTIPADGSEVSVGAVAFTFIGLSGGSMGGGNAMKLEVLNPASNVAAWRKVGAY